MLGKLSHVQCTKQITSHENIKHCYNHNLLIHTDISGKMHMVTHRFSHKIQCISASPISIPKTISDNFNHDINMNISASAHPSDTTGDDSANNSFGNGVSDHGENSSLLSKSELC